MGILITAALLATTLVALRIRLKFIQPPEVVGSAVSDMCLRDIQISLGRMRETL